MPGGSGAPFAQVTPGDGLAPAYFDVHGQPVAHTKISTVGSASATESVGGRTMTDVGEHWSGHDHETGGADEDMLSLDTSYRDTEVGSESGYGFGARSRMGDMDAMDEDLASRSVGGFEDRTSDDGSASLVGFGEGAGSTVSGPIYHRRPVPAGGSAASAMAGVWVLERSSSGLSEGATMGSGGPGRRDTVRAAGLEREGGGGTDTPISVSAMNERREARMVDGVATPPPPHTPGAPMMMDDVEGSSGYVDTTTRGPIPVVGAGVVQPNTSAIRETQQPQSHQHWLHRGPSSTSREAVERMIRERLDDSECNVGSRG